MLTEDGRVLVNTRFISWIIEGGRSILNGGADTTGQSGLGGRAIAAHADVAAPSVVVAHESAAPR